VTSASGHAAGGDRARVAGRGGHGRPRADTQRPLQRALPQDLSRARG
jgi:hypothetical protein